MPCHRGLPAIGLCPQLLPRTQEILSQYHFRILIPQSAFKHTSQSPNHYKTEENTASHMHAFNSMKVARKRQTLGQLNIAFHSHVSVGDAHVIKGTTFLWEANEEGDKFIKETRQCHISAISENSLLPWPSGSHRSVSPRTCDWSFKNKTQSQTPHFSGRVHTEDMVTSSL